MFGKKKKLLAEIESLKYNVSTLTDKLVHAEEINDDFEALQEKYDSLEIKNQFLKAQISESTRKVAYYESLGKVKDIETQLKSNEAKHKEEIIKKNEEINNLTAQNMKLASELDLLNFKARQSSGSGSKNIDVDKLMEDNSNYSKTNARLNTRISELEFELKTAKEVKEHNIQMYSDAISEVERLRSIFKHPKNTKLKCEYTAQYKIKVVTESGLASLYNADIFIVNYSLYSFNETGSCMKELGECKYFLERFYWPRGGYISFCDTKTKGQKSTLQIFPDGIFRVFVGNDKKKYSISFSLDFIVEPTKAELLQITTKKNNLSKLLLESRKLHNALGELFDRARHSIEASGVDLPTQSDILRDLNSLSETYKEIEKEFKNFTKKSSEQFKSKSEKIN